MTSPASQQLREQILAFVGALPMADTNGGGHNYSARRKDGVEEFSKHWCVRGNHQEGVFASFIDCDDTIEFGLLERNGDVSVNLLHVTVILEDGWAELNSISESNMEMNFDAEITPDKNGQLEDALSFFGNSLKGLAQ